MTINKTAYGIVLGIILPIITAILFYKYAYHGNKEFMDFLQGLVELKSASMLLAVSALSNLAFFMLFAQLNKLFIARGILVSTAFYAIMVLIFKFGIQ